MTHASPGSLSVYPHKLRRLYWPFLALAEVCRQVIGTVAGSFSVDGNRYTIPRFTYLGPEEGTPQTRIGVFALLHGDEPAGAAAILKVLETLAEEPEIARGYDLVCYPVCNPTGYEDDTRHNRAGADLNREFWRGSSQPEVRILEEELRKEKFDGIVTLHADSTSHGIYGYSHGRVLNTHLLRPALSSASVVLPLNRQPVIDGFAAEDGVIAGCFGGILAPPVEQRPRPFDLIFETPGRASMAQQAQAGCCALLSVLAGYRGFLAQGENL